MYKCYIEMKEGHRNSLHCFIMHVYISKKLLLFEEVRNLVTETRCKLLYAHAVADHDMRQPLSKKENSSLLTFTIFKNVS